MTPVDTESHLFFAFVLKTQTSGSFLEALSIICPGLVRLQLHFIFILRHSLCKQPKMESGSGGGPKTVNSTAAASLALSASAVRSVTRGMRSSKRSRGSRRAKAALCPHQCGVFRGRKKLQALRPAAASDFQSGKCVKVRRRATYVADKAQPSSGTICAWPLTHTDRSPVRQPPADWLVPPEPAPSDGTNNQPSADWLVPPEGAGLRLLVKTRNSSVTGEDGPVTSIVSNIMFQRSVAREHFISPQNKRLNVSQPFP